MITEDEPLKRKGYKTKTYLIYNDFVLLTLPDDVLTNNYMKCKEKIYST